jgi:hypothetical protein
MGDDRVKSITLPKNSIAAQLAGVMQHSMANISRFSGETCHQQSLLPSTDERCFTVAISTAIFSHLSGLAKKAGIPADRPITMERWSLLAAIYCHQATANTVSLNQGDS